MADEYTQRYGKVHKSQAIIIWCLENMDQLKFPDQGLKPFAIAIKDDSVCRTLEEFDESNPVDAYRLFYKHDKAHLHKWKRNKPEWI